MTEYTEKLNQYKLLNSIAEQNGSVFFGADWLCAVPLAELAQDNEMAAIYNRSLQGLTIKDAEQMLETCILALQPGKVFINIGENDIRDAKFDAREFIEKYEWLLYTIHANCKCSIYILSVVTDKYGIVNEPLKALAEKYGCEYVDILACRNSWVQFFSKMRFFLRRRPITFCEAMQM